MTYQGWNPDETMETAAPHRPANPSHEYHEPYESIICGFTPINQSPTLTTIHDNHDRSIPEPNQEPTSPDHLRETPIRGRKRPSAQLATPPNTFKKAKKPAAARATKAASKSTSTNEAQTIDETFKVSKPRGSNGTVPGPKAYEAVYEDGSQNDPQLRTTMDARPSSKTLEKLAAFRYQTGPWTNRLEHDLAVPFEQVTDYGVDKCAPRSPGTSASGYAYDQDGYREDAQVGQNTTERLTIDVSATDTAADRKDSKKECFSSLRLVTGAFSKDVDPKPLEAEQDMLPASREFIGSNDHVRNLVLSQTSSVVQPLVSLEKRQGEHSISILDADKLALGDSDDDFPVDEEAMEELLLLSTMEESPEPLSSLRLSFMNHSPRKKIYDQSLKDTRSSSRIIIHSVHQDCKRVAVLDETTMGAIQFSPTHPSSPFMTSSPSPRPCDASTSGQGFDKEDLIDDEYDQAFLALVSQIPISSPQASSNRSRVPSTVPKLQWNPPTTYDPSQLSFRPWTSSSPTRATLPPCSPTAQSTITPQALGQPAPFCRPPFPKPVLDRSPIQGLTPSPLLRTCFRIGEALNAAALTSRSSLVPIIELYARVTYSRREGGKQHFQFADLFRPDKPPFLGGCYEGWKGVELLEDDGRAFSGGGGKMARVVGRMERVVERGRREWRVLVMAIWEVEWEDVEWVRGIVCAR